MADKELTPDEFKTELMKLFGSAKSSVLHFEMLDFYNFEHDEELLAKFRNGTLDESDYNKYFSQGYELMAKMSANGVVLNRVHVVTLPLTEYIICETENYKLTRKSGEKVYFIERRRFYTMPQPSDIEICDFVMVDDAVMLLRYEFNTKLGQCKMVSACLITDKEKVEKYQKLESDMLKRATPMDDFISTMSHAKKATVDHDCKECGNKTAVQIFFGLIWGDEAPLEIYKCTKCGHVVREGFTT